MANTSSWREIQSWDRRTREELKEHVIGLAPIPNDVTEVQHFNILLTGPLASGKSSFFNSIDNILRNLVIPGRALSGSYALIFPLDYRVYKMKTHSHAPLPWRIIDTTGFGSIPKFEEGEAELKNLLKAIDGHVPENYTFTPGKEFTNECPGFVVHPSLSQKTHCVAIVLDSDKVKEMTAATWKLLCRLRQSLLLRKIPTYIILTHIDEACYKVEQNVQNVLSSSDIRDVVKSVSRMLDGFPQNQIFPVKNYHNEVELIDDIDILLLHALRQMLHSAQTYIESKIWLDHEEVLRRLNEEQQAHAATRRNLTETQRILTETSTTLQEAQSTNAELREALQPDWILARNEIELMPDRVIGIGAWGSVVEGRFRGSVVAVKKIHDLILSSHNRRLFEREMNIASRCRHPCLLQFIGATNDDGNPLFVTELLDTSLRAVLQERALEPDEIKAIALDAARALNYLHLNRPHPIIHRDISSANVLLWKRDDRWRAKVSDYGTANFMQYAMTKCPGAVVYSAPEAQTSRQSPKVDVYSFGVLLCEMNIRELPDPERRNQQVDMVTNQTLRDLIRRCLIENPQSRPAMEEIALLLERL